jgi:hypothetical protein
MRIAIVHLSDLHLVDGNNVLLQRAEAIGNAARASARDAKHCFLLVSGDVAFSGKNAEYGIAELFLNTVLQKMQNDGMEVTVALVPGNHDCNFETASRLRPLILDNKAQLLSGTLDDETITACTSVQRAFFEFGTSFGLEAQPSADRMLSYAFSKDIDGQRVAITCYNTAWVSKIEERAGDLWFPVPIEPPGDNGASLAISMFHHPYSWLSPENRRAFVELIETTSDLVLTGHEHVQGYFELRHPADDQDVHYVEGAVLQDLQDPKSSAFNVLGVDTDCGTYTVTQCSWERDHYNISGSEKRMPFVRNQARRRSLFTIRDEFHAILNDPGRDLHHSRKRDLELFDIFVYPQFRVRSLDAQLAASKGKPPLIDSDGVLDHIIRSRRTLILGPNDSGKTSLCRMVFRDLRLEKDYLPVLLSAEHIKGCTYDSLISVVSRSFSAQYSSPDFNTYREAPKDRRALIVDDFHKYRLNAKAKSALIEAATSFFAIIVLVGDDILQYEEVTAEGRSDCSPYFDFVRCDIQPFGFKLRERLIRRWVAIGREYTIEQSQIDLEVRHWEHIINTLIGANVIPAYPLTLLVMLQAGQAAQNHALTSGAYGYVYEALITRTIASVGDEATDTDTKYAFLSWLAFKWFSDDTASMSESTLISTTRDYLEQLELDLEPERLIRELVLSEVLEKQSLNITFRYDYYLHYFTARYMRDALASGADVLGVRATLTRLVDTLYYQPYANILVIYLYLNRDTEVIKYLLDCSKRILQEYQACDLDSNVEFLNKLDLSHKRRALPAVHPVENRDRYLDEIDAADSESMLVELPEKIQYADDLHPYLKFDIAFKTLQVLGQVLRNFPGSLSGPLKLSIAEECYGLSFRVLQAIVSSIEQSYPEFRQQIEALIRERRQIDPEMPMPRNAEHFIMWMCLGCSFGVIRRLSEAVGHQRLRRTYAEVLRRADGNVAFRLVDFSIALDQYGSVPEADIKALKHSLRSNPFAYRLLQDLGFYHMCMWSMDVRQKQQLAQWLEIDAANPKLLDNRGKLTHR